MQHLDGLAALGQKNCDILLADDAKIAVHAFYWVQKTCRRAGRGQRGRDLSRDEPGFPNTRDEHAAVRRRHEHHGPRERVAQATVRFGERIAFHPNHAPPDVDEIRRFHRFAFGLRGMSLRTATYSSTIASHSPRARNSASANSRTAPAPPRRVSLTCATLRISGTALLTATA